MGVYSLPSPRKRASRLGFYAHVRGREPLYRRLIQALVYIHFLCLEVSPLDTYNIPHFAPEVNNFYLVRNFLLYSFMSIFAIANVNNF